MYFGVHGDDGGDGDKGEKGEATTFAVAATADAATEDGVRLRAKLRAGEVPGVKR